MFKSTVLTWINQHLQATFQQSRALFKSAVLRAKNMFHFFAQKNYTSTFTDGKSR